MKSVLTSIEGKIKRTQVEYKRLNLIFEQKEQKVKEKTELIHNLKEQLREKEEKILKAKKNVKKTSTRGRKANEVTPSDKRFNVDSKNGYIAY